MHILKIGLIYFKDEGKKLNIFNFKILGGVEEYPESRDLGIVLFFLAAIAAL